ncbi:MAG: hypothetical protein J5I90_10505 [Caldilineales bacterium]|nr:hypothetical protein [Caldilineales bacterium]
MTDHVPPTLPCSNPALNLPPTLRTRPAPSFAHLWRRAGKSWPRDLAALSLLGTSGWSSRLALNSWLVAHHPRFAGIDTSVLKRLWPRLAARGLVATQTVVIDRRHHLSAALVWLSDLGYGFLREQGLPCITLSEWDRLRIAHDGESQPVHTAMVILAAHYFRQRGYMTEVCPPVAGAFAPDLLLVHAASGARLYVEVEAPAQGGKAQQAQLRAKWELMAAAQGFVALCAATPRQCQQRRQSARQVTERVLAADLLTLAQRPDIIWSLGDGRRPGAGGGGIRSRGVG